MAEIFTNGLLDGMSRRFGNVVLVYRNGKSFLRKVSRREDAGTEAQLKAREAFTRCVAAWKSAGGVLHDAWDAKAKGRGISGFNAFIKANAALLKEGKALDLSREFGEEALGALSGMTGAAGAIQVSYNGTVPAGKHLTLFCQPIENGMAGRRLSRHDMGTAPQSPLSVTGLEAGNEYFLYAMITDAAYAEATTVSAAVSCRATAGTL